MKHNQPSINETTLIDNEFISQFENQTLDSKYFNHLGHLRIAWLYLTQNNLESAIEKTCSGIKAYAESLNAKDKFHLTITYALLRIMAKRIDSMSSKNWDDFIQNNDDLVEDATNVLSQYYTHELLFSSVAKTSIVDPDIKDF